MSDNVSHSEWISFLYSNYRKQILIYIPDIEINDPPVYRTHSTTQHTYDFRSIWLIHSPPLIERQECFMCH